MTEQAANGVKRCLPESSSCPLSFRTTFHVKSTTFARRRILKIKRTKNADGDILV